MRQSDIDWSAAQQYRKKSVLAASNVRTSEGGEHIVTLNSANEVEREGDTKPGDRVVIDGRGQPYIIKSEKFDQIYEIDPAQPSQFRSKNFGVAIQVNQAVTITREDDNEITAAANDWLFHSQLTNTVNVIADAEFGKTYAPETGQTVPVKPAKAIKAAGMQP